MYTYTIVMREVPVVLIITIGAIALATLCVGLWCTWRLNLMESRLAEVQGKVGEFAETQSHMRREVLYIKAKVKGGTFVHPAKEDDGGD